MIESILMVLAISLDSFVIGIACGTKDIKLPKKVIIIINIICTAFLAVSIFLGNVVRKILPGKSASIISFFILLILGVYYIFDSLLNTLIEKRNMRNKKIEFEFFNINIIIDIVVDGTKADINKSGDIDFKESIYLALALSLDALGVGFGSSLGVVDCKQILITFFIFNMIAIFGGLYIGSKFISRIKLNISWISGLILIFLGLIKLF